MQLPFFFEEHFPDAESFALSGESSRHIVQVLRMTENEHLLITNGKGELLTASLTKANKKSAEVKIINRAFTPYRKPKVIIGISLIKNRNRFEWFLEKATEIGVHKIIPFISERTEKQHFRYDRMRSIVISAMLQSQQSWLPELLQPIDFGKLITTSSYQNKYIAHCIPGEKENLSGLETKERDSFIVIGPEGDFSEHEIELAIEHGFTPVSLGETRLRTETAGFVAAVLLSNNNKVG